MIKLIDIVMRCHVQFRLQNKPIKYRKPEKKQYLIPECVIMMIKLIEITISTLGCQVQFRLQIGTIKFLEAM